MTTGKIVIKKDWGDDSDIRYAVYLRLPFEVSIEKLGKMLLNLDDDFEVKEVEKKDWKNRGDDVLWKVISEVDKRPYPSNKYIIYLESKYEKHRDGVKFDVEEALEDLKIEQLSIYMNVKRISRFPWEVETKTIPITAEMLKKAITKKQNEIMVSVSGKERSGMSEAGLDILKNKGVKHEDKKT